MTANDLPDENLSPLKRALVEIRSLKKRVAEYEHAQHEPIALIGMGMRLPGGNNTPEDFWRFLAEGGDAVGAIPADRWDAEAFYAEDPEAPGKMYTRHGAFLEQIDQFSPHFFAIAPREAAQMDPQQRLLLQVAWEALENAGQAPDQLNGTQTGVFIGICNSDYFRMLAADTQQIDVYLATGSSASVAAGRISYLLGLQGPSMAIDTACSSSLVAIHLAVRSLRSKECNLALAGGVNLILTPEVNITFSKAGMMALDGRCKTFDAAADGYVRGEGCAMVVLKRLSDALADGDQVLAVIRGTAVNQDGRSSGLTAPNGPAQEAVIRSALADAGLAPADVSYVEAHGTGTPLGDPIEVQALSNALGGGRGAESPLRLGSVKTNLGHLEAAAGIAGLIKTVLMLQHGQIVPHLNFTTPSPHIPWDTLPLDVPTTLQPWSVPEGRRAAGISSFGFSGTNAHIIVEEAPAPPPPGRTHERPLHILALSAKSERALRELAGRYAAHLAQSPGQPLADIAFTANSGRAHFEHRLAATASDHAALRDQLAAFADGAAAGLTVGHSAAGVGAEVAFLFTGHGSHYAGMGQTLYMSQPVFQAALDRCSTLLAGELDRPLTEILFGDGQLLDTMLYAQPALFALQYALAELWQAWGVRPTMVAGHSAGEYVAAVVAGVLSLEDGLHLIATRGRLMQSLPANGEMVAIFAPESVVAGALAPYASQVGIAALNGSEATVISGQREAVGRVLADLELEPNDYRRLDVSIAAHSPLVEPILAQFEQAVSAVQLNSPQIGLVSSLTGKLVGDEIRTPHYWRRHLREPVRFAAVFDTLREAGYSTFVEIGPHPTLLKLGQRCWPNASATWVPSLRRKRDEWTQILESLATLYTRGIGVDWAGFDRPYQRRRVSLPTYPWENDRYWSGAAAHSVSATASDPWPALVSAARTQAEHGPLDLRVETYAERWALLNDLADSYIVRALCDLGLFTRAGEAHTAAEIMEQKGIQPFYNHLLVRWLDGLAGAGLLRREDDRFIAERPLARPAADALLAAAEQAFADAMPVLAYLQRCGDRLGAVLVGEESPLSTLFPDGSYETVDYIYNQWAMARYFNGIVRAATVAAAHARPERPLRVLEIGAGSGGTTATLLPTLPPERTSYHFTDVSDFFLARAAERFAAYPFVRYGLLNIEQPPAAQGYPDQAYDLIVAANVLHATRDLDVTLRHARGLLAPGGTLLLYETTRHPRWFDITTSLIEGWQLFDDSWRGDHPLIPADTWSSALQAAGFAEVLALPEAGQPTAIFGQHILIARAPGQVSAELPVAGLPTAAVQQLSAPDLATGAAEPIDLRAALAAALPDERRDLLVEFVRRTIGRVLRIGDPRSLQREQGLLDLGFDSLMAVELRNVLRQELELPGKLPATLIFDYPTIAAIADYLGRLVFGADQATAPAPAPVVAAAAPSTSAEQIAALSDEEVEALLLKRLADF